MLKKTLVWMIVLLVSFAQCTETLRVFFKGFETEVPARAEDAQPGEKNSGSQESGEETEPGIDPWMFHLFTSAYHGLQTVEVIRMNNAEFLSHGFNVEIFSPPES